jgi:hypothetical protein
MGIREKNEFFGKNLRPWLKKESGFFWPLFGSFSGLLFWPFVLAFCSSLLFWLFFLAFSSGLLF